MLVAPGQPMVLERKYLGRDESEPILELAGYGALRGAKVLKLQEDRPIDVPVAIYPPGPDSEFQ